MKVSKTESGFGIVEHEKYTNDKEQTRLIQASSAIGDYDDSCDNPGSSYLWVGKDHHLNREEIQQLTNILQIWLMTGKLK